jgi:hypothetical protein
MSLQRNDALGQTRFVARRIGASLKEFQPPYDPETIRCRTTFGTGDVNER